VRPARHESLPGLALAVGEEHGRGLLLAERGPQEPTHAGLREEALHAAGRLREGPLSGHWAIERTQEMVALDANGSV
jgi:hypothetical protein